MKLKEIICCIIIAIIVIAYMFVRQLDNDTGDMSTNTTESQTQNVEIAEATTEATETDLLSATTEIYNDNDIIISAMGITKGKSETVVDVTIANNSDKDYNATAHSYSVNGLMAGNDLYDFNGVSVSAGKQSKLSIEIDNDWLSEMGIDEISTIEVLFWFYYDDYKDWDTDVITIQTNLYSETNDYTPTGSQVFDNDNMSIWVVGTNGNHIQCIVKNKTSLNADYTIDNCSVNEWTYEILDYSYDYYDEPINGGAYAYVDIEIDDDFLNEYGVDNIDSFIFTVNLCEYDTDSYKMLLDDTSDKITVNFE